MPVGWDGQWAKEQLSKGVTPAFCMTLPAPSNILEQGPSSPTIGHRSSSGCLASLANFITLATLGHYLAIIFSQLTSEVWPFVAILHKLTPAPFFFKKKPLTYGCGFISDEIVELHLQEHTLRTRGEVPPMGFSGTTFGLTLVHRSKCLVGGVSPPLSNPPLVGDRN